MGEGGFQRCPWRRFYSSWSPGRRAPDLGTVPHRVIPPPFPHCTSDSTRGSCDLLLLPGDLSRGDARLRGLFLWNAVLTQCPSGLAPPGWAGRGLLAPTGRQKPPLTRWDSHRLLGGFCGLCSTCLQPEPVAGPWGPATGLGFVPNPASPASRLCYPKSYLFP